MTKLVSDQLPSFLTWEEAGFIQGHSGESRRGRTEEQTEAVPGLSVSPATALVVTGQRSVGNCALAFGARCAPSPAPGFCRDRKGASKGVSVTYWVFWWVKKSGCKSECAKPPGSLVVAASDWVLQHPLRRRWLRLAIKTECAKQCGGSATSPVHPSLLGLACKAFPCFYLFALEMGGKVCPHSSAATLWLV